MGAEEEVIMCHGLKKHLGRTMGYKFFDGGEAMDVWDFIYKEVRSTFAIKIGRRNGGFKKIFSVFYAGC